MPSVSESVSMFFQNVSETLKLVLSETPALRNAVHYHPRPVNLLICGQCLTTRMRFIMHYKCLNNVSFMWGLLVTPLLTVCVLFRLYMGFYHANFLITSSLQAWQKSLPAETVSCLSGNSHMHCDGDTDFGSKLLRLADLRLPRGGWLMATFLFLPISAGWGQCSLAKREGTVDEGPATSLLLFLSAMCLHANCFHNYQNQLFTVQFCPQ